MDFQYIRSLCDIFQQNQIKSLCISETSLNDIGIRELVSGLIGNVSLKILDISLNLAITDEIVPNLKELATKSRIRDIIMERTCISTINKEEIIILLSYPDIKRDIPQITIENIKSAAKSSIYP